MKALSTATIAAVLAAAATLATAETQQPSAFASTAAQSGMIEVALGGLALQKSNDTQVRQFAQKMIQDHGQANQELYSIVKREGLTLPTKLDAKYDAIVTRFNAKSGAEFDKAYIAHMVKNHADELTLFESASRLSDPGIAGFAQKSLSMLQEHEQLAEHLRGTGLRTASAQ